MTSVVRAVLVGPFMVVRISRLARGDIRSLVAKRRNLTGSRHGGSESWLVSRIKARCLVYSIGRKGTNSLQVQIQNLVQNA